MSSYSILDENSFFVSVDTSHNDHRGGLLVRSAYIQVDVSTCQVRAVNNWEVEVGWQIDECCRIVGLYTGEDIRRSVATSFVEYPKGGRRYCLLEWDVWLEVLALNDGSVE